MNIDWNLVIVIAMPIITLFIGAWASHVFESRPNLISYLGFISGHRVKPKEEGKVPYVVNTHSVIIKNTGRKAATNVRLGHNDIPDLSVNVCPDIEYTINDLPGGCKEVMIPTLIPKKEITINYLYFHPDTWDKVNTHIESDAGKAKVVTVLLQPQPKPWQHRVIFVLLMIGCISSMYLIWGLITWLAT